MFLTKPNVVQTSFNSLKLKLDSSEAKCQWMLRLNLKTLKFFVIGLSNFPVFT